MPLTGVGFQPDLVWIKSRRDSLETIIYMMLLEVLNKIIENLSNSRTTQVMV